MCDNIHIAWSNIETVANPLHFKKRPDYAKVNKQTNLECMLAIDIAHTHNSRVNFISIQIIQDMGFHGAKFPLPFGPAQGQMGMRKNIELVRKWREAVGEDYPLMIDCYMSLTVPYTIELARRCEPYNVKWIEETLPPDEYEGYARIKEKVASTLLTTGEHEYTRWGFRTLLEKKCCDVLQPDITCK